MKGILGIPILALILSMLLTGCGDGGSGTSEDAGTGTNTLLVVAHVVATESICNASSPNDFNVAFDVLVSRSGVPIDDATVQIQPKGADSVSLASNGYGTGRYSGSSVGYARTYRLDVEVDTDNVRGACAIGPDIHTFTSPEAYQVVVPEIDLEVAWQRDRAADEAAIETNEFSQDGISDSGSFTVDGIYFEGDSDEQEEDYVILWRTNHLGLTGGVGGSELVVTLRNRVDFLIDTVQ